jgi:hypothetical protein
MSSSANRALAPKHEKLKRSYAANKPLFRANEIAYTKHKQITRPLLSDKRQAQRIRFRQHF